MVGHLQGLLLLFTVRIVPVEVRWLTEVVVPVQEPVRYPPLAEDAITPQPLVAEVFPHAETAEAKYQEHNPVVHSLAYVIALPPAEAAAHPHIVRLTPTAVHQHIVLLHVAHAGQAVHSLEAHRAEAEEVVSPVVEEAVAAEEDKPIAIDRMRSNIKDS